MFKKSGKTPFTPFICNKLIYRMLNKKVKGEGLKTLFTKVSQVNKYQLACL